MLLQHRLLHHLPQRRHHQLRQARLADDRCLVHLHVVRLLHAPSWLGAAAWCLQEPGAAAY